MLAKIKNLKKSRPQGCKYTLFIVWTATAS